MWECMRVARFAWMCLLGEQEDAKNDNRKSWRFGSQSFAMTFGELACLCTESAWETDSALLASQAWQRAVLF